MLKRMGDELLDDYFQMRRYMEIRDKVSSIKILKAFYNYLIDKKREKFIKVYSSDISPRCILSNKIDFRHALGIVIGNGVIVEENVVILQNVTIGAYHLDGKIPKTIIKKGTVLGAGCAILGSITIGENVVVGANSVVTVDVPDNSIVVGVNKIKVKKSTNDYHL